MSDSENKQPESENSKASLISNTLKFKDRVIDSAVGYGSACFGRYTSWDSIAKTISKLKKD
jgi:hypothetical protein